MADEDNVASEEAATETYTPEEKAYLDTRGGEKPVAAEQPAKVEAEPAESSVDDVKEAAEPANNKERKVDYGALAEERTKRREAEERAHKLEVEQARYEERWKALREMNAPQNAQPQPPPDPNKDIFGAFDHLAQEQAKTRQEIEAHKKTLQQEAQWQQLAQRTAAQETEFKKTAPDYDDAWGHLVSSRSNELRYMGTPDHQIQATLQRESRALMLQAVKTGKNPAEVVYELAKQRGYTKKQTNGHDKAEDLNAKLDTIEAGQAASKSLSTVGGQAGGGEVTMRDIINMDPDEFEKFKTKSHAKYRRLLGG